MLFYFYKIKINKFKLLIQLILVLIFFFILSIKDIRLIISAIKGCIVAYLSNISFFALIIFFVKNIPEKFFPWNFIIAVIINIFISTIFLILALKWSKNFYLPLFLTWLLVKIMQILIPVFNITKINDKRKIYVYDRNL